MYCNCVNFVENKNKWSGIDSERSKCCDKNCINTSNPIGNCIEGNGFVNIISDENINWVENIGGENVGAFVYAENSCKRLQYCFNYSLYYFEVKSTVEGELNDYENAMMIGFKNCSTNECISFGFSTDEGTIVHSEKGVLPGISPFTWNKNDTFGCGLVYPPTNMTNAFPYVFFTQNGKQIGKAVLVKENHTTYKPFVGLRCCSAEANFGNDLETKPFKYDIFKHLILKEFYEDSSKFCSII
uniref:Uncharacterized protein n=1 Tax=Meloidogyne enterolobii TaxID=390850 RepID=A0A6V7X6A1_MELEN|nr:unnamed protein product [Meloidogyne enterolobii]